MGTGVKWLHEAACPQLGLQTVPGWSHSHHEVDDKDTHMGGTVIALEVLESRYWVRSIFCLSSKRSPAMAMSHRWSCPFRLKPASGSPLHRIASELHFAAAADFAGQTSVS